MGRPPIEIDEEQVLKLAKKLWTTEAIAQFFDVSRDTIERRFAAILAKGRSEGKMSINDAQLYLGVVKKNATMLIWLGKQHLGQSDKQAITPDVQGIKKLIIEMGDGPADEPEIPTE